MEGYKLMFDRQLVTVWSAPNYVYRCDRHPPVLSPADVLSHPPLPAARAGNVASILELDEHCEQRFKVRLLSSGRPRPRTAARSSPSRSRAPYPPRFSKLPHRTRGERPPRRPCPTTSCNSASCPCSSRACARRACLRPAPPLSAFVHGYSRPLSVAGAGNLWPTPGPLVA